MSTLEVLGYLASLLMGLILGLTGGGGSLLAVPIFVYLFQISAIEATSYSLGIIGLISLWGAYGAYKNGDLKLKAALLFGIPGIIGVILSRRLFLPSVPETVTIFSVSMSKNSLLLSSFALVMLFTSLSMLKSLTSKKPLNPTPKQNTPREVFILLGLFVGMLSGFVGAGGGFLIVPALLTLGKLDMRKAVGTSLFIIGMQSSLGILSDFHKFDSLNPSFFFIILLLATLGMSLGTKARSYVSDTKLRLGFAVMVLVMAVVMIWDQLLLHI